ncbi:type II toxin-antitoxin system RelE/ParE family toxin [Thiomicrospira microaerophila]|uniref:type II toxin-antitoxin system RelE/ParE family toxin n=1 Tax=Thiomicrospira microaerophila TaxID=406020 RepID=UPI00200DF717|nr:type II toxin-antitoxin system RelE/ParE family toxin [Thiomicrospira microaerophila]UQB42393.1 type II toxin-antitoxin system RelE/ParE family toxin [Thiomicrospira microaerophila]
MAYFLTAKAERDIVKLIVDGTRKFGFVQAETYHQALTQAFQLLSDFPETAPLSDRFGGGIRIYPFKKHVILYSLQARNDVLIVRVRHSRENWLSAKSNKHTLL